MSPNVGLELAISLLTHCALDYRSNDAVALALQLTFEEAVRPKVRYLGVLIEWVH